MQKKLISIILAIAMLACMIPLGTLTAFAVPVDLSQYDWEGDGDGTEGNPYEIDSTEDLEKLAEIVTDEGNNCAGTYFVLTDDIIDSPNTVIGSKTKIFNGHFNGNGHTVTLWYPSNESEYYALFSALGNGGKIINLTMAGYVPGDDSNKISGGVCGQNNGTIANCCNTAEVSGSSSVGGVCGENNGTITNCCNTGTVRGGGGVCGSNNGTITNCYNTGTVSGDGGVGGVCGYNEGIITNCYNTGTVSGGEDSSNVGGVCGDNCEGTIANCYNTAKVSGDGESYCVGGVCGENWNGTIANCYNTGTVSGYEDVGGVCGCGNTTASYELPTEQMQAASGETYTGDGAELDGKPLVDLLNDYVTVHSSDNLRAWTNKQGEYPVFVTPHTHTKGTEYMTDGRAHWLKCDDENCPLNKADDPVLAYEIAFSSYEGPELKEALDYSEKCGTYSEEKTSMLMGRQGKLDKSTGTVSNTDGRTIIGLTQDQLDNIGSKLIIVGCDDSDNNKQVSVNVDCAYTWFYNINAQTGEAVKVEAANTTDLNGNPIAAFVIIDSSLAGTITGFGYYRVYNDTVSDGTLIGEALYKAPRTFKAVYDTTDGANTLNFYFDYNDHAGEGKLYDNLPTEANKSSSWGYTDTRSFVKGVVINQNVIKYKDLKSTNSMFSGMNNASSIKGAEYLDVSSVTNMNSMFISFGMNQSSINEVPAVERWNTSGVTNMGNIFYQYGMNSQNLNFALDLSGWDVSHVSTVSNEFSSTASKGTFSVTIPHYTKGLTLENNTNRWYVSGTTKDNGIYIKPLAQGTKGKMFTVAE